MLLLPYLRQLTKSLWPVVCIEVIGECPHWRPVTMTKHLQRSLVLGSYYSLVHFLMKKNGLVNQVKLFGLVSALATSVT